MPRSLVVLCIIPSRGPLSPNPPHTHPGPHKNSSRARARVHPPSCVLGQEH
ncbi:hypothetical protein I79_014632 [Cricetulus griseus]|uniref:Uncharacterized protein n=1 Tax=Cricetulus griseus TaxID=10029 RepID=G3HUM0_CRIGR|nr:hypothetical protein I79_014632 [Cricetulus griseus]